MEQEGSQEQKKWEGSHWSPSCSCCNASGYSTALRWQKNDDSPIQARLSAGTACTAPKSDINQGRSGWVTKFTFRDLWKGCKEVRRSTIDHHSRLERTSRCGWLGCEQRNAKLPPQMTLDPAPLLPKSNGICTNTLTKPMHCAAILSHPR